MIGLMASAGAGRSTSGEVIFRDTGGGAIEPILDVYADTNVNVYTPGVYGRSDAADGEGVHGHGTGRLRRAVRKFLDGHVHVADASFTGVDSAAWSSLRVHTGTLQDREEQYMQTAIILQ